MSTPFTHAFVQPTRRRLLWLALMPALVPALLAACTDEAPLTAPRGSPAGTPAEARALVSPISSADVSLLRAGCDDALARLLPAGPGAAATPLHGAIRTLRAALSPADARADRDAIRIALAAVHAELDRSRIAAPAESADLDAIRLELATP